MTRLRNIVENNIKTPFLQEKILSGVQKLSSSKRDGTHRNGVVFRVNDKPIKFMLKNLHPQYVFVSGSVTLKKGSNKVTINVDRIGSVSRNANSLSGGSI